MPHTVGATVHVYCTAEGRERNDRKGECSDDSQKTRRGDGADVKWRCSSFQTREKKGRGVRTAATGNARSPTVDDRVRR